MTNACKDWDVLFDALLQSNKNRNIQAVRDLIDNGTNVDSYNRHGHSVLMEATCLGHVECVSFLLESGADVNKPDKNEKTALMKAAETGHAECVKVLLEAGASMNKVDVRGQTALMHSLTSCVHRLSILKICRMEGDGARENKAYVKRVVDCFKLLINAGADIDTRNNTNLKAIDYALMIWPDVKLPAEYLMSMNCNFSHASYNQIQASLEDYSTEEERLGILKLLFAIGLPRHLCQNVIVKQDASIKNWIETVASQPSTLQTLCVFKMRRILGIGIKSKVNKLSLPNVIQNLILLKGTLSLECFI